MRLKVFLALALAALGGSAGLAKDVYLPIVGNPGNFKTDVRLINPSSTTDIVVNAIFLPAGQDNTAATSVTMTVPKRSMVVRDDAVRTIFGVNDANALGAIKLTSPDNFIASMRIYTAADRGTMGQFAPGIEPSEGKTRGVLIQLKAHGTGSEETWRTSLGFMNPNTTAAVVTVRMYDKANAVVGTPFNVTVPPMSVEFPRNAESPLRLSSTTADFSEAWVSFESTQPVIGFASITDNRTADPFFELAFADPVPTTTPTTKTFNVTARQFSFSVSGGAMVVNQGDHVIINVTSADVVHGFALERYALGGVTARPGSTRTIEFDATVAGIFTYFCTETTCGTGHLEMTGELEVIGPEDDPGGGGRY